MEMDLTGLRQEERVSLRLRGLFEQYGYKRIKARMFEDYALYLENRSFLAAERVITFTDPEGRLMALKPDVTLSLVKNTSATAEVSEKLYYIEDVCRLSREKREFREISQMGLELFGGIDAYAAAEVVRLALLSLDCIDADSVLDLSHMGFTGALLDALLPEDADRSALLTCIQAKNRHDLLQHAAAHGLSPENARRLARLASLYGSFPRCLSEARAIAEDNAAMHGALDELESIYALLEGSGLETRLRLDFSIVNDISYYTGVIFHGYVRRAPRAVLSGGRYDKLPQKFGSSAGAIGFALYLDQVAERYAAGPEFDVDVLILYPEACDLRALTSAVQGLLAQGLRVRTERNMPENLRCRSLFYFVDGELKEDAPC